MVRKLNKGNLLAHKLKQSCGKLRLQAQFDWDSSLCDFLSSPLCVGFCPQIGFSNVGKKAPAITGSDPHLTLSWTRQNFYVPESPFKTFPVILTGSAHLGHESILDPISEARKRNVLIG